MTEKQYLASIKRRLSALQQSKNSDDAVVYADIAESLIFEQKTK